MRSIVTFLIVALLLIGAILTPLLGISSPIEAGAPSQNATQVSSNTKVEYTGKSWYDPVTSEQVYEYRATIDSAPSFIPDLVTPIDPRWYYNEAKGEWYIGANLFEVIVKDSKVTVEKDGWKMTFEPTVLIGTKDTKPITKTPTMLPLDPINSNYLWNTLVWEYPDCKRHLRIIEGMLIEEFIFESDPGADVQIESNLYKDTNFVWDRPPYAYDANGNPLEISENKVVKAEEFASAAYPVVIDPTTTFYTSSDDADLYYLGGTFNDRWTAASSNIASGTTYFNIGQRTTGTDKLMRGVVYFDTSAIPDVASISSANLSLEGYYDYSTTDFNIVVQSGMPTYPHRPPEFGDYNKAHYSGDGGSINTNIFTTTGYNDIVLNATGRSWINKAGWTKFMLRSDEEIAGSAATTNEYVQISSYEQGIEYRPKLIVTYASATVPSVTTNAATYVTTEAARLNSYLDDDGGGECEVRFEYDTDSGAPYALNTSWVDGYTTGESPYANIDSLDIDQIYYFRVQAKNDEGTTSGSELDFTTESSVGDPSNLVASPSSHYIDLSWFKGTGASQTEIRYKSGSYPADETDGDQAYIGTASSYRLESLSPGTTYYLRAWGLTGDNYSGNYTETFITTLAGGAAGDEPPGMVMPSGWFQSTDYTRMEVLGPVYDGVNIGADTINMPYGTAWLILTLLLITGVGFIVFKLTHGKLVIAGGIALACVVGASYLELLPLWMAFVFGIVVIGLSSRRFA